MKCFKCGSDNIETAIYCSRCGVRLEAAAAGGGIEGMGVAKLVIYTFLTAGIYAPIWFMKRINGFNALNSEEKLTHGPFGFILAICIVNLGVLCYASVIEAGAGGSVLMWIEPESRFMKNMVSTVQMLDIVFKVILLFQCIKVKRIISEHISATNNRVEEEISLFYMVLWGLFFPAVFYLQYKLNRMNLSERRGTFNIDKDVRNA